VFVALLGKKREMFSVLAVTLKERDDIEDLGPEWRYYYN
jgi:hypothetical protein